jgi:flagellar protein FlbD
VVILVHRLRGEPMLLNADLIESVEATPDTVITLVDGRRLVVADQVAEIAARVRDFRAAVLIAAERGRNTLADVIQFPSSITDDGR